jgi:hypothetical protein
MEPEGLLPYLQVPATCPYQILYIPTKYYVRYSIFSRSKIRKYLEEVKFDILTEKLDT